MSKIVRGDFGRKCNSDKNKPCCVIKNGKEWCPHLKWYLKDGCPFENRRECDNYKEQTGKRV